MVKRSQASKATRSASKSTHAGKPGQLQTRSKMSKMVRTTTKGVVTRYHKAIKKLERY